MSEAKKSGVYFLTDKRAIKIGHSRDIDSRIKRHQTGASAEVRLQWWIDGAAPEVERHLHTVFADTRIVGEWFWCDADFGHYAACILKPEIEDVDVPARRSLFEHEIALKALPILAILEEWSDGSC